MSKTGSGRAVIIFTLVVIGLLVAIPLIRAAVGLLMLGQVDESDGSQSLRSAEKQLLRQAHHAVADAMGSRVALVELPDLAENPTTSACGTFNTGSLDSPRRSSYEYTLAGTDSSRFSTYASRLGDELTAGGWNRALSGAGDVRFERAGYALEILSQPGERSVVLKAETPCLTDEPS